MIATFASFALPFLFIGSGVFALAVLTLTWRAYGRELSALRAQLAITDDLRAFDLRVARVEVREFTPVVRRNAVRRAAVNQAGVQAAALPAAARRPAGQRAVA